MNATGYKPYPLVTTENCEIWRYGEERYMSTSEPSRCS